MRVQERDPEFLKANGHLEKVPDFCIENRTVLGSRLGYRITPLFADRFLGRIFETPAAVFTEKMLRPERQDLVQFAAGVDAIVETQARVARQYFEDGTVQAACPPLKALLHIMACGNYEGKGVEDPDIRGMFTRDALMASSWYAERLRTKQRRDIALWTGHLKAIEKFQAGGDTAALPDLPDRLALTQRTLARVTDPSYVRELEGTIGADPFSGLATVSH
jgi:hypothetical protein